MNCISGCTCCPYLEAAINSHSATTQEEHLIHQIKEHALQSCDKDRSSRELLQCELLLRSTLEIYAWVHEEIRHTIVILANCETE